MQSACCNIIITHLTRMSRYVPGIPVHMHPYITKMRLVIGNWLGINKSYL